MTPAEIAALSAPLSEEEPCGPDLEMLGDADYMRFTARIDGVLPKTFANFDRGSIDFPAEFATLKALLAQSRDLRLLAPLAKLLVLNRDVAGYAAVFKLIETLIDGAWPSVVPGLIDGDAVLRIVTLQTLDDMADSVMPLQSAPLFETRRFGKVSYRSHLLASGTIQPRAGQNGEESGEEVPSASALGGALAEVDLAKLVEARTRATELQQSLGRIESLINDKSGQPGAMKFDRLGPLVRDIAGFLDKSVAARDPALALAGAAPAEPAEDDAPDDGVPQAAAAGPALKTSDIQSTAQAQQALEAVSAYFAQFEPSSPILMLIGQARALVGRNFYEALQVLLPDQSATARLRIGQEPGFVLMFERLAALAGAGAEQTDGEATSEEQTENAESGSEEQAAGEEGTSGEDGHTNDTEAGLELPHRAAVSTANPFRADDRRTAMALLQQVSAHFRRAEPSSPIPVLLERAESIAGKDFFGLLRETFPAGSLKVDEQPG
jgi:type VI secretion system protein ImpA